MMEFNFRSTIFISLKLRHESFICTVGLSVKQGFYMADSNNLAIQDGIVVTGQGHSSTEISILIVIVQGQLKSQL
jgi:hypothetical protein